MQGTLPFEYGTMYRPIIGKSFKSEWILPNQGTHNSQDNYNYNSYNNGQFLCSFTPVIDSSFDFFPMAFSEKTQMVIGEVIVEEQRKFSVTIPQSSNSGISFMTTNTTERSKSVTRIQIEVNDFIRDFEKVL